MHVLPLALERLAAISGAATPTPTMTVAAEDVTPGFAGFVAVALVAVAAVLLVIDMLRRIRRAGYRAEISEELDAQQVAADAADERDIDPDPTAER
ncbi:hypothetical protein [Microbacterium sp.]|uniref:hypothetical protein n=1 Tax=Microbacterium sp. TaxID=51671 RepID=UPI0039E294FA